MPNLFKSFLIILTGLSMLGGTNREFHGKVKSCVRTDYEVKTNLVPITVIEMRKVSRRYTKEEKNNNDIIPKSPDRSRTNEYKDSKIANRIVDSLAKSLKESSKDDGAYRVSDSYNKYDRKGNRIESMYANEYGNKYLLKYNKSGQLIERDIFSSEGLKEKFINVFDHSGNIRSSLYFRNDTIKESARHKYIYDKVGNWIIDSTFTNDTLTYIRTQNLEYW